MAGKYPFSDKQDIRRNKRRPTAELKRTPLKRSAKPLKKTPIKKKPYKIPKKSAKRKEEDKIYFAERALHLKLNPVCQLQVSVDGVECMHEATEIHHAKGKVGKLYTDRRYFKSACRPCHTWVELHPDQAKELGYSVKRLD